VSAGGASPASPGRHLGPAAFSVVMGLSGLALAALRAEPWWGPAARAAALGVAVGAAVLAVGLVIAGGWRAWRHADAWAADWAHPVRHAFVAAVPVALLLLATLGVALDGPGPAWRALWIVACTGQLAVTVAVLGRWLRAAPAEPGALWPGITPVLFIPMVGHAVVPLAGVPLGHPLWSAAQFGVGAFFWPVVLALLLARRLAHGPLPLPMTPAWCILLAPPAVVGLGLLALGAPTAVAVGVWGVGGFVLLWLLTLVPRLRTVPFGWPWWGLSFPLAAFAALTLQLALAVPAATGWRVGGLVLLALAAVVIGGLLVATGRALVGGTLLVPEAPPQRPGEQAAKP
jgi:tellurite resistance protein